MSNESKHCPFCGSAVEKGSVFCQNCGASITGTGETTPAPAPQPVPQSQYQVGTAAYQSPTTTVYVAQPATRDDSLATVSLVMGILGILCIPGIGSLIAVITGHISYSRSKTPVAIAGLVLCYIPIIAGLIWLIIWVIIIATW
ncbi:MAG: hypothetical protein HZR80_17730 [Candidatus Heimdallarchaeota archaeon]